MVDAKTFPRCSFSHKPINDGFDDFKQAIFAGDVQRKNVCPTRMLSHLSADEYGESLCSPHDAQVVFVRLGASVQASGDADLEFVRESLSRPDASMESLARPCESITP